MPYLASSAVPLLSGSGDEYAQCNTFLIADGWAQCQASCTPSTIMRGSSLRRASSACGIPNAHAFFGAEAFASVQSYVVADANAHAPTNGHEPLPETMFQVA